MNAVNTKSHSGRGWVKAALDKGPAGCVAKRGVLRVGDGRHRDFAFCKYWVKFVWR